MDVLARWYVLFSFGVGIVAWAALAPAFPIGRFVRRRRAGLGGVVLTLLMVGNGRSYGQCLEGVRLALRVI